MATAHISKNTANNIIAYTKNTVCTRWHTSHYIKPHYVIMLHRTACTENITTHHITLSSPDINCIASTAHHLAVRTTLHLREGSCCHEVPMALVSNHRSGLLQDHAKLFIMPHRHDHHASMICHDGNTTTPRLLMSRCHIWQRPPSQPPRTTMDFIIICFAVVVIGGTFPANTA